MTATGGGTVTAYNSIGRSCDGTEGVNSPASSLEASAGGSTYHEPHQHNADSYGKRGLGSREAALDGKELKCMHIQYSSISDSRGGLSLSVAAKDRKCV